jgi:hypothetical protein
MDAPIVQLRTVMAIGAAALCILGGCGGDDGETPGSGAATADPQTLVTRYFEALGEGDGALACGLLTEAAQEEMIQLPEGERAGSCEEAVAQLAKTTLRVRSPRLRDLRPSGQTATATITSRRPQYSSGVLLRREGGGWKIAYPPAVLSRFTSPPGIRPETHDRG